MKRNEIILASILGVAVVGFLGRSAFDRIFIAPVRDARESLTRIEKEVEDKSYEEMELLVAAKQVGDWGEQSLPGAPTPATGQRLYILWLEDMAQRAGLKSTVEPGRRANAGTTFTAVQANMKGDGTFDELRTFLDGVHRVNLLHRIVNFKVTSDGKADPLARLPFELTFEALSTAEASDRSTLFTSTDLPTNVAVDANTITISSKSLPARPQDWLLIDDELVMVREIEGDKLSVERGVYGTEPAPHDKGAQIVHYPVRRNENDESIDIASFENPFAKPFEYTPEFKGMDEVKIVRGNPFSIKLEVEGADPKWGASTVELVEAPPGMQFDAKSAELSWSPSDDVQVGEYPVHLRANFANAPSAIDKTYTLSLTEANTPPTITPLETETVFHDDVLDLQVKATDAETPDKLQFAVQNAPEGLSIDSATGKLNWKVPATLRPGDVSFVVTVTDQGEPTHTTEEEVSLTVRENLKSFVFFVGTIRSGDDWIGWLWDRAEGKRVTLSEGEEIDVVGFRGLVHSIGESEVLFEAGGEILRLSLGDNLEQLEKIPTEPVVATRPPVESRTPKRPPFAIAQ